ncbi:putative sporulation protein YtxC [Paenibacillus sp.]|jgi:putative sporulation protein YtxC|uniref:putative sporulation protein YtxC n=1 Tax=Paenibacillus sp. TaxID=58172 RepID=UPI00281E6170|nr:putative sporulation protein YtxC [Paenibacillus sp.]MDR0268777.1 putative sporulation protein YtxC [Paenibacillus sp.]
MELFSIAARTATPQEAEQYNRMVSEANQVLHKKYKTLAISCSVHEKIVFWCCREDDPRFFKGNQLQQVYETAARTVAEYILLEKEQKLVEKILEDEFDFPEPEEHAQILKQCLMILERNPELNEPWGRRRGMLEQGIRQCLTERPLLHIDGFLTFRAQTYVKELREIVEYAVDEFLMDRQYEEFVHMLKYFVYFQQPQVPLVHLIHKGGQDILLLDEEMEPLQYRNDESVVVERLDQQDLQMEDAVVTTLISVSPAKIIIHTREPHMAIIRTLSQIFEQRMEICRYCPDCHAYFRETGKL